MDAEVHQLEYHPCTSSLCRYIDPLHFHQLILNAFCSSSRCMVQIPLASSLSTVRQHPLLVQPSIKQTLFLYGSCLLTYNITQSHRNGVRQHKKRLFAADPRGTLSTTLMGPVAGKRVPRGEGAWHPHQGPRELNTMPLG